MQESGISREQFAEAKDKTKYYAVNEESKRLWRVYLDLPVTKFILRHQAKKLWEDMNRLCEDFDNGKNVEPAEFDNLIKRSQELIGTPRDIK